MPKEIRIGFFEEPAAICRNSMKQLYYSIKSNYTSNLVFYKCKSCYESAHVSAWLAVYLASLTSLSVSKAWWSRGKALACKFGDPSSKMGEGRG